MTQIEIEIRELKYKLLDMAELVQRQVDNCILALKTVDYELARKIIKKERKVDKYDLKIDKRCEKIVALYQPVASDLRFVFSVMKINNYLESIGDNLNSIAVHILEMKSPYEQDIIEKLRLEEMLSVTKEMVSDALTSFFKSDSELSRRLLPNDSILDDIKRNATSIVVDKIRSNPEEVETYIRLLFIINKLEKIGDYAVNIAEEVIFYVEAVVIKHAEKLKEKEKDKEKAAFEDRGEKPDEISDR